MGALGGVNYHESEWSRTLRDQAKGFDVIIDSAGGPSFSKLAKLCNRGARIVFYGATTGHWQNVDAPRLFLKQVTLAGSTMGTDAEFEKMIAFVNKHGIVPCVSNTFPLSHGNEAFKILEGGKQFGKLVLLIDE